MVVHVLKQIASRFEVNFHVRGTDFIMKQPLLVQQGDEELLPDWHWDNYIMGFTKPIEQYLFSDLLINIHVFMYLKDIIRGGNIWRFLLLMIELVLLAVILFYMVDRYPEYEFAWGQTYICRMHEYD